MFLHYETGFSAAPCGPRVACGMDVGGARADKLGQNLTIRGYFGTIPQNVVNKFVIFLIHLK